MSRAAFQAARSLDDALREITPAGVASGARRINSSDVGRLFPVEHEAIARSVDRRRREFATGRVLLRELIRTSCAIPVGDDRAPVLPDGVSATLAHDRDWAVAAVTRTPGASLGIDIEPVTQLSEAVASMVLRPEERSIDAHLAFTLKEAAYKAWSRSGGRMLEHHDVLLELAAGAYSATVVADHVRLSGRYARTLDRWVALVVTPQCRPFRRNRSTVTQ